MMQEFTDSVQKAARNALNGVHTAFPGKIVSYDTGTGLATVAPQMKYRAPDGRVLDYPNIYGVPVVFPQAAGQKSTIAIPVKSGDGCLVVIAEQALDYWMYGQETDTNLAFDLTNAICIPGLFAKANSAMKRACASGSVIVEVGGVSLTVGNDGVSIIGKLTVTDDVVAGGVSLRGHKHTDSEGGSTSTPY